MRSHKIEQVEGIGPVMADRLRKAGVRTLSDLLERGRHRHGRAGLAETSGIADAVILKWVNMADLFRVPGVGGEYAELLEKAGVDTVKELRTRNPENLHASLAEANGGGRRLVRQLPGLKRVSSWTTEARRLPPVVTY